MEGADLELGELLAAAEAAPPGDSVEVVALDLQKRLGAQRVSFLFVDLMGQRLIRLVAAGGGGLTAGVACAVKQVTPATMVFAVEPEGADSLRRSIEAGTPQAIDAVRTIADSLGAPHAAPYSFGLVRRFVDELVLVDDDQLRAGMSLLLRSAKLAVEPAGAAATAALCGPLLDRLRSKRVGLIVCGANIDEQTFAAHVSAAKPVFAS